VIGISGGAPHALACAALLPDRALCAAVLVTPAPSDDPEIDFLAGQNDWNRHEFTVAAESEERFHEEFAGEAKAVLDDPDRFIDELASGLPEVDRRMLERPAVRAQLKEATVEAFRPGIDGWFDDDRAFLAPWDVPLESIRCPVRIWQGELDVLAPRAHGERVAQRIPGAQLEVVPGAGHLLVDAHLDALAWLADGA
jgi:pimeloyl-ACP methyl ester carboxylesterase